MLTEHQYVGLHISVMSIDLCNYVNIYVKHVCLENYLFIKRIL